MSKEIYISSTPHETRLAIVEKEELTEIYYERENEYTLAGSIYNGRVTRVLPGMQSSFVDIGLERDAFLYITDFMEEAVDTSEYDSVGDTRAPRLESPREAAPREATGDVQPRGQGQSRGDGQRGRGRGRRDGRSGRNREPRPQSVNNELPDNHVPVTEYLEAPLDMEILDTAPSATESDETSQDAPVTPGTRRWRGRRGRRRGRGVAASEVETDTLKTEALVEETTVAPPVAATLETPHEARQQRRPEQQQEGQRSDRGGRNRRGGRDRKRQQDSPREPLQPRDPRPERHEARRMDVRAAAPTPEPSAPRFRAPEPSIPEVEPFILPGESLSKYRGEAAAVSETASQPLGTLVTARPSSEAPAIVGWDGGAVLPGETIRRRETTSSPRTDSRSEGRREPRGKERGSDRGRDRRRGRDEQRGRQEFKPAAQMTPAEAVLPAVTSQHDVAESEYEAINSSQTEAAPAVAEETFQELHEAVFQETTTEYEPGEEASASFRVDPLAPREFRQSVMEEEFVSEEHLQEHIQEHIQAHEFTSVQPTGEMVSEVMEETVNEAAPIEHEQAVQAVTLSEAAKSAVPFEDSKNFAPGHGQLEEELIDDEDEEAGVVDALHARAVHDVIEEEDETLEHAAELGRMLRDMSIDEIVRPAPVEVDEEEDVFAEDEEEEDFEEDELESNGDISGSDVSEIEEEAFAESAAVEENGDTERPAGQVERRRREDGRRGRRDGRRGGRGQDSNPDRNSPKDSERSTIEPAPSEPNSATGRERGGHRDRRGMAGSRFGGRDHNRSVQATNMPSISDLLKPGQEVLVQIAKEPMAKKGARITSHIALPGRFLVFMPTVGHTGVSRKIESVAERRRLKEILLSERGEATGGFIVRTAAAGASEEDLRSDLRFLLNLWAGIKERSESSKSPALIYHDLNLIERILRDQVTDNFSAIWCDTETEYDRVLKFLQRFQPALARRVKLYEKDTPLFEQFGINAQINNALQAKVWLKSGGSIVINQTEALVAIDINTGKYVGKTTKLEDTILKTNLDAIPEIVRQMRLRDLGGIIIIDFIDMDERKNRNKVMAALEEELKKDRAPSKVLPFNDFGLVAITRKRVKQSLERTLSTTCSICQGTGMTKSPVTVCNDIWIAMKKIHKTIEKGDILLRVHPEVVKQLKLNSAKWLTEMETMSGKTILLKSDPSLHPEQFDIH
jgi:ribonuclease G